MLRRPLIALAVLITHLFLACGCRFQEPFEVPFLWEHEPTEEGTEDTIPILFSAWSRKPERDETRAYILWPGLRYLRQGRALDIWLLGFPVLRNRIDHRGFEDFDVLAGPVWYGHSADEGSYLTVFPFGGTLKGILGKDYGLFVAPPLFIYVREKQWKSFHVLFPFINWWTGGGRSGFRVFPFYAHYEREDPDGRLAFKRTWVLWPFWQTLENNLNAPSGAQRMWFLFPFFGYGSGPDMTQWTVLFPLFKYAENRGSSYGGPTWEIRAPWPFVRIQRGNHRNTTDIWPFFGIRERRQNLVLGSGGDYYRRRYVLWPIFRDEKHDTGEIVSRRWWTFPILWNFESYHRVDRWSEREFKVWPLFRYKKWKDGTRAVNIISPFWFQDPEGPFERIYGPLTRVYHEWRDEEGAYRHEILWGIYGKREFRSPENEEVDRTSVLFGLFQYESRGERSGLRLFYLPTIEWGEKAAPVERKAPDEPTGVGGQRTPG